MCGLACRLILPSSFFLKDEEKGPASRFFQPICMCSATLASQSSFYCTHFYINYLSITAFCPPSIFLLPLPQNRAVVSPPLLTEFTTLRHLHEIEKND